MLCCGPRSRLARGRLKPEDTLVPEGLPPRRHSGNIKSLLTMFLLFTLITTTQYVAAVIANSLALQADCVSMAVDALSYLGNMIAECHASTSKRGVLELIMSGLSLLLLGYFTGIFFVEAAHNTGLLIEATGVQEEEERVDPYIVLTFAALGILFDVLSLLSYKVWHVDPARSSAATGKGSGSPKNVNMLTALLHVLSDLLRSTTTFVEGIILLQVSGAASEKIDGWSALFVCTLIFLGVIGGCVTWAQELAAFCAPSQIKPRLGAEALV